MKPTALCIFLLIAITATAQEPMADDDGKQPWEQAFYDVMSIDSPDEQQAAEWDEAFELLTAMADNPFDLNHATREDLEQLPFLTPTQVEDIEEYLYRYGPMKSLNELRMITSLDYARLSLLRHFVYVGTDEDRRQYPQWKRLLSDSRHQLTGYVQLPCFTRRGDNNGYLGYRYKHWLQYELTSGDRLRAGLVGAQDAGEPFFANNNRMGYDFYSFYLQLKQLGRVKNLMVGKYKVAGGMGLVLSNGFSMGKLASLQTLGRTSATLRPHASRSTADYFQGAAATIAVGRNTEITALASYRPFDATLNNAGEARTIVTSGYHRTLTEMAKKDNTHALAGGLRAAFRYRRLHLSANAVYTHFDRRLQPDTRTLYRRYYAQGTDFVNVSADYGYHSRRFTLNGETAIDGHGAMATLNSLSLLVADGLQLMALQRFYSYRYTSLYAHSLSESGNVQNESAFMGGITWQPTPQLRIQAYTDYAYAAWPRYRISKPGSHSSDHLVNMNYTAQRWSVKAYYRLRLRQRDNGDKSALVDGREQRARLAVGLQPSDALTFTTQADMSDTYYLQHSRGYALSQLAAGQWRWLVASASFAYFHTDSYDSRIYLYERAPLYAFSFPALSGEGIRYSLMLRATLKRRLILTAKVGVSNYFDRNTIGTGLQQSEGSSQTTVDIQCRWKF